MKIDANLPGGNIVVERIEGDEAWVHQDLRTTQGSWFYWYFRVTEAAGRTIRIHFTEGPALGARGPGCSLDGGRSWHWLGTECVDGQSFVHTVDAQAAEVHFSFGMPYTEKDLLVFLERHTGNERLSVEELCRSREKRSVRLLRVASPERHQPQVLVTSRHHACEMMANYVLEGLLEETLLTAVMPAELIAVPFVDTDGVENGDQGKNRQPCDHNRDYNTGRHPETVAIRHYVNELRRLMVTLDLHCPYISGKWNELIYQVGAPEPPIWHEQQVFGAILEDACTGPLPYKASNDLPWGEAWNTTANFAQGKAASHWLSHLPHTRLVSSFEIPYANAEGAEVNAESARAFGANLAQAIGAYLREQEGLLLR